MATRQLEEYIRKAQKNGAKKEQVRQVLGKRGWATEHIEAAFESCGWISEHKSICRTAIVAIIVAAVGFFIPFVPLIAAVIAFLALDMIWADETLLGEGMAKSAVALATLGLIAQGGFAFAYFQYGSAPFIGMTTASFDALDEITFNPSTVESLTEDGEGELTGFIMPKEFYFGQSKTKNVVIQFRNPTDITLKDATLSIAQCENIDGSETTRIHYPLLTTGKTTIEAQGRGEFTTKLDEMGFSDGEYICRVFLHKEGVTVEELDKGAEVYAAKTILVIVD